MPKSGPEPSSFSYPSGKFYSSFKAWTVSCPSEIFLDPTRLHTTLDLFSMLHTCVCLVTQSCLTLCDLMNCSLSGSSVHWGSPGKNSEVGCYALLQGIFPTQGLNPGLSLCRQILYHLSHQGSPWILDWVAYPFAGGSSQPRNSTRVSCFAGGFFTSWATREAHITYLTYIFYI